MGDYDTQMFTISTDGLAAKLLRSKGDRQIDRLQTDGQTKRDTLPASRIRNDLLVPYLHI